MDTKALLKDVISAANDLKYIVDVQRPGTLFFPGGKGDARESFGYSRASEVLASANAAITIESLQDEVNYWKQKAASVTPAEKA